MADRMRGKVALITGGGSGIGRATALALAKKEVFVAISDVSAESGNETVELVRKSKGNASFIQCDVSKAAQVKDMLKEINDKHGRLDIALNNAGVIEEKLRPITDYPNAEWERMIGVNLTGIWLCMKYEIPEMLEHGEGVIINVASDASFTGAPGNSGYAGSKHGVIGITKSVALEYAKSGIRINAICPGVVDTPMTKKFFDSYPDEGKSYINNHPLGRMATAEEIADVIVWMCSDSASYLIGHSMVIDGGSSA